MTDDGIRHAEFCTPRPELTEPRVESFRYGSRDDGRPAYITRCCECGEQVVVILGDPVPLRVDPESARIAAERDSRLGRS